MVKYCVLMYVNVKMKSVKTILKRVEGGTKGNGGGHKFKYGISDIF
jgi:hypothetical protein